MYTRVLFKDTIFTKKRELLEWERSFVYDRSQETSMDETLGVVTTGTKLLLGACTY